MQKMKWDDEEDPSDLDDDDFSAFETLRKVASMPLTAFSPLTFFVGSQIIDGCSVHDRPRPCH
jgi:hypothetical protein